jgi:hypothetical protein
MILVLLSGCVEQSPDAPTEADVKAAREHLLTTPPTPQFPSGAVLVSPPGQGQGRIIYLGLDVDEKQVTPGKGFTLTHYFKAESPTPEGWRLFVHLDSGPGKGHQHLNADHVPIGGKYPVPLWKKGEIIRDIHKVSLPPSWTADKVEIYVGIWKGQLRFKVESGQQDGENRVLAATLPVSGAARPPATTGPAARRLVARRLKAGTTLNIDGKLDEPAWKEAASTGSFVQSLTGAPAEQNAEARVLWDDKHLYVAFDFADKDIWGTLDKHDDKLWTQEAAELFIDADNDAKTYIEIQVSPKNVVFDSWLPAYRQNDNAWDAPVKSAVQVSGTLNKRDDVDKGWTVELMIPHAAVKGRLEQMRTVPPRVGTEWRVNFFRMDMPAGKPQTGSAWSPPLVGDFHALDKFGVLVFGDEQGQLPKTPDQVQVSPGIRRRLLSETGKMELKVKAPTKEGAEKKQK